MGKPFGDDEDDEDVDLSMVLGSDDPPEDEEGELEAPLEAAPEAPEEAPESDAGQVLDEVMAKLEELRGLVTSL
jgi:hypothetical protein